jgi:hypothetical protein
MSMQTGILPAEFADLEPFMESWGKLETAEERYLLRQQSRLADLRAFYDAMVPRMEAAFDYLDKFPIDAKLPPAEDALFRLALGMTEVGPALEVYGQPEVPFVPKPHVVSVHWNDGTVQKA